MQSRSYENKEMIGPTWEMSPSSKRKNSKWLYNLERSQHFLYRERHLPNFVLADDEDDDDVVAVTMTTLMSQNAGQFVRRPQVISIVEYKLSLAGAYLIWKVWCPLECLAISFLNDKMHSIKLSYVHVLWHWRHSVELVDVQILNL